MKFQNCFQKLTSVVWTVIAVLTVVRVVNAEVNTYSKILSAIEPGETQFKFNKTDQNQLKIFQKKCSASGCGSWKQIEGLSPELVYTKYDVWAQRGSDSILRENNAGEIVIPAELANFSIGLQLTGLGGDVLSLYLEQEKSILNEPISFEALLGPNSEEFGAFLPRLSVPGLQLTKQIYCEMIGYAEICLIGNRYKFRGLFLNGQELRPARLVSLDIDRQKIEIEFLSEVRMSGVGYPQVSYKVILSRNLD